MLYRTPQLPHLPLCASARRRCRSATVVCAGKTSLVKALAGSLGLSIYALTLSSAAITDDSLRELLASARDRGILLLEDIDAAFGARNFQGALLGTAASGAQRAASGTSVATPGGGSTGNALTFSGLLNALDGVAAQEGKLLFMTTNHVDALDPALIRPGRVDVRCEFSLCSREQARQIFLQFYASGVAAAAKWGGAASKALATARKEALVNEQGSGASAAAAAPAAAQPGGDESPGGGGVAAREAAQRGQGAAESPRGQSPMAAKVRCRADR
jgi:mitochondrial chaperone BCS1